MKVSAFPELLQKRATVPPGYEGQLVELTGSKVDVSDDGLAEPPAM